MTADEIADAVVLLLNAADDPPQVFEAKKPQTTAEAHAENDELRVFVLPYDETETAFTQGGDTSRRDRVVSIVVNGKVNDEFDRAAGMKFSEWARLQLEESEIGRYRWEGNEVVSLYDADALKTKNQFLSLARAGFYELS